MRVLVTGLSLQGNKGGAALALALAAQLAGRVKDLEITFAVSAGPYYQYERLWAERFGVEVTGRFVYGDLLRLDVLKDIPGVLRNLRSWLKRVRETDLIIDLSAISYVGPPASGKRNIYRNSRFSYFLSAKVTGRPFLAWTQSYGPFSTPLLKLMARMDLGRQPIIFCRGEQSREEVRKILPEKRSMSFPDVATTLPMEPEEAAEALGKIWKAEENRRLITVTPSAVLFSRGRRGGEGNAHLSQMVSLCRSLSSREYRILLVPHTFRPGDPSPSICDTAVCKLIMDELGGDDHVRRLEGDLSPSGLKSVISSAHLHVSGRYHSLIAALSTGVPAIAISWHHKYYDVMEQYGLAGYVCRTMSPGAEDLLSMLEEMEVKRDKVSDELRDRQRLIELEVAKNADIFVGLMGKYRT